MEQQKLIMLYGYAGSGKTTMGKLYGERNPLTLILEGDEIISMISGWQDREPEAREIVFELTEAIVSKFIEKEHSVVIPYLPVDSAHLDRFENIAKESNAEFIEIFLSVGDKDESLNRLFQRGSWGEKDAPPLIEADRPVAAELYDLMITALEGRNYKEIRVKYGNQDDTFDKVNACLE